VDLFSTLSGGLLRSVGKVDVIPCLSGIPDLSQFSNQEAQSLEIVLVVLNEPPLYFFTLGVFPSVSPNKALEP